MCTPCQCFVLRSLLLGLSIEGLIVLSVGSVVLLGVINRSIVLL